MLKKRMLPAATLLLIASIALAGCGDNPTSTAAEAVQAQEAPTTTTAPATPTVKPAREGAVRVAKDPTDIPAPIGDREPQHVKIDMVAKELDGVLKNGMTYEY